MYVFTIPMMIGRKKPPRPPAAPTTPVTAPTLLGNSVPTILKTAPLKSGKRSVEGAIG
jgi:hypothetical protein